MKCFDRSITQPLGYRRKRLWRNMEHVESETLKWMDWFNNRPLLEPIGDIPPTEFEELYYENLEASATVAGLKKQSLRKSRGGS